MKLALDLVTFIASLCAAYFWFKSTRAQARFWTAAEDMNAAARINAKGAAAAGVAALSQGIAVMLPYLWSTDGAVQR